MRFQTAQEAFTAARKESRTTGMPVKVYVDLTTPDLFCVGIRATSIIVARFQRGRQIEV